MELISYYFDDPLAGHFGIEKTQALITKKYYCQTLYYDIKAYIKGCDICLASKTVCYKLYGDL